MADYGDGHHCNVGIPVGYADQHAPNTGGFYVDANNLHQIPGPGVNYLYYPNPHPATAQLHYHNPNIMGYNHHDHYYNHHHHHPNTIPPAQSHFAQPDIISGARFSHHKPTLVTSDLNFIPATPGLHGAINNTQLYPSVVNPPFCNGYYGNEEVSRDPVFNSNGEIHQQALRRVFPSIANRDNVIFNQTQTSIAPSNSTDWNHHHHHNEQQHQHFSGHNGQPVTKPAPPQTIKSETRVHNSTTIPPVVKLPSAIPYEQMNANHNPHEESSAACMPVYNLGFLNESVSGQGHHDLEDSSLRDGFHICPNHNLANSSLVQQPHFSVGFQQPPPLYDTRVTVPHFQRINERGHDNTRNTIPRNDVISGFPRIRPHAPEFKNQTQIQPNRVNTINVAYNKQALPYCNSGGVIQQKTSYLSPPINDDRSIIHYGMPKEPAPSNHIGNDKINNIMPTQPHTINQPACNTPQDRSVPNPSNHHSNNQTKMADDQRIAAIRAHMAFIIEKNLFDESRKTSLEAGRRLNVEEKQCSESDTINNNVIKEFIRKGRHGIVRETPETYVGLPPFVLNETSPTYTSSSTRTESFSPQFNDISHRHEPKRASRSVDAVVDPPIYINSKRLTVPDNARKAISFDDTAGFRRRPTPILSRGQWWRSLSIDQLDHSRPISYPGALSNSTINQTPAEISGFIAQNEVSSLNKRASRTRQPAGKRPTTRHRTSNKEDKEIVAAESKRSLLSTSSQEKGIRQASDTKTSRELDDEMDRLNRTEFHLIVSPRASRSPTPTGARRLNRLDSYNYNKSLQGGEIVGIKRLFVEKSQARTTNQNAPPTVQQKVDENVVDSSKLKANVNDPYVSKSSSALKPNTGVSKDSSVLKTNATSHVLKTNPNSSGLKINANSRVLKTKNANSSELRTNPNGLKTNASSNVLKPIVNQDHLIPNADSIGLKSNVNRDDLETKVKATSNDLKTKAATSELKTKAISNYLKKADSQPSSELKTKATSSTSSELKTKATSSTSSELKTKATSATLSELKTTVKSRSDKENRAPAAKTKSVEDKRLDVEDGKSKSSAPVPFEKGSIPWTLSKYIDFLKTIAAVRENNIQAIENTLTASRLGLKSEYSVEGFQPKGNRPSFYGSLSLSGVFIARATALNKKTLKHKVYEKALNILTTYSVQEILALGDSVKHGEAKNVNHGISHMSYMKDKLQVLQEWFRKHYKDNSNAIYQLQKAFADSECGLVYSYQPTPVSDARGIRLYNKCQLLVEEKILATAICTGRKDAKIKVSEKLMEDLLTLDVDNIYNNLMQNKDKEAEEEIWEYSEQQAKSKRSDPESLLDLLIAKVREHYNTQDEGVCSNAGNTVIAEHIDTQNTVSIPDNACDVTSTPNACMDDDSSKEPMTFKIEVDSDPMTSEKEVDSEPMTSETDSDLMTSGKEANSEPMTSEEEANSVSMTSEKQAKSVSMTSENDANSDPMTSENEAKSESMTSEKETNSESMTSEKEASSVSMTSENEASSDPMTSEKEANPTTSGNHLYHEPMVSGKEGSSSGELMTSDKEAKSDPMTLEKEGESTGGHSATNTNVYESSNECGADNVESLEPGFDVQLISKVCIQLRLKLTTVFEKIGIIDVDPPPHLRCIVYLAERRLADVPCSNRKVAQDEAFKQVSQALLLATSARDILDNYPVMQPEDLKGENVVDIVFKGYSRMTESNRCRLHRTKRTLGKQRQISDLVILEHEDWTLDRVTHANCILVQSASMSGMLLEWICEEDYGVWRCEMFLQGVNVARCVSKTKRDAVAIASVKTLYSLYETQPIIKGYHSKPYSSVWVTRKKLHDRVTVPTPVETVIDIEGGAVRGNPGQSDQLQPEVKKAIWDLVSESFHQPTLNDLVIAPDWTPSERRFLHYVTKVKELRFWVDAKVYGDMVIISMKLDLLQYVEILKAQPTLSQGRYRLLPESERPSLNDVAGEIAVNESFVCGMQSKIVSSWVSRCMERKNRNRDLYHKRKAGKDISEFADKSGEYVTANNTLRVDDEEEEVFKGREGEGKEEGGELSKDNDGSVSRNEEDAGNCMKAVMPVFRRLLRPLSTSTPGGEKKSGRERRIQSEGSKIVEVV